MGLSFRSEPIHRGPKFRTHFVRIPNSMVAGFLAVERNKGPACFVGIFTMGCSWLSGGGSGCTVLRFQLRWVGMYTMPYHYLGTPSQSAVTKRHIFWWMNVTDCDIQKNRTSAIHRFFCRRKVELGWIRPRMPCLRFCGNIRKNPIC
jgi:hypothetical protein